MFIITCDLMLTDALYSSAHAEKTCLLAAQCLLKECEKSCREMTLEKKQVAFFKAGKKWGRGLPDSAGGRSAVACCCIGIFKARQVRTSSMVCSLWSNEVENHDQRWPQHKNHCRRNKCVLSYLLKYLTEFALLQQPGSEIHRAGPALER